GCFLNGCCYGTPSGVPWHVYQHGAWRHPAQIYSGLFAAALFAALLALRDRLPREGDLFRVYLLLFGTARLLLELFRERTLLFGALSGAQWVCRELALAGAAGLALSRRPAAVRSA